MGVSRHVVVADTDEAALAIARRAYPRWRASFRWLFARHGTEPRVIGIYPPTFDELMALNNGVAGSPDTVRRFIEAEVAANDCNYFVPQMVFGDMTLTESLRSIELFAREVMPAFANLTALALQLHRHHGGVFGVAQRQRGLDVAHMRRAGQLGDEGLEGLEVRRHAFQNEVDLARQHPAFAHQRPFAECWMLSGEIDFVLKCVAPDLKTFQAFVAELTAAPHVRNVKTSLTLRNSKDAAMVPMELKGKP